MEAVSHRRDSAHTLQNIQGHALERKQFRSRAFLPKKRFVALECLTVLLFENHFHALSAKHPSHFFQTGGDTAFTSHNDRGSRLGIDPQRLTGQIPRLQIDMQECSRECADSLEIIRICKREFASSEEGIFESLLARRGHLMCGVAALLQEKSSRPQLRGGSRNHFRSGGFDGVQVNSAGQR